MCGGAASVVRRPFSSCSTPDWSPMPGGGWRTGRSRTPSAGCWVGALAGPPICRQTMSFGCWEILTMLECVMKLITWRMLL
uniref:Uncharacterized protein n=1 Tax=Leersia perrieri TaxID=77586 RepID=A0A0D9X8C4_9ORYZ